MVAAYNYFKLWVRIQPIVGESWISNRDNWVSQTYVGGHNWPWPLRWFPNNTNWQAPSHERSQVHRQAKIFQSVFTCHHWRWNQGISCARQEQHRRAELADLPPRRELVLEHPVRYKPNDLKIEKHPGHVRSAGESVFEDEAGHAITILGSAA